MRNAIQLLNVSKKFAARQVLRDISLNVERGRITCLLGPNGAGKTTLIQILVGLTRPDHGTLRILGEPRANLRLRQRVGCTPQDTQFPPGAKVDEILGLVASHYPDPLPIAQ